MKIKIINGPNLNLLGIREPEIYGTNRFQDYFRENIALKYKDCNIVHYQYNIEGQIIEAIHESYEDSTDAIIINPGGYSHTSIAILDAIKGVSIPTIEVHISNVHAREEFRKNLITAKGCIGVISGCGLLGYNLAIQTLIHKYNETKRK